MIELSRVRKLYSVLFEERVANRKRRLNRQQKEKWKGASEGCRSDCGGVTRIHKDTGGHTASIALLTMKIPQFNVQTFKTSSAIRLQLQQSREGMTLSNVWAESKSGHMIC